MSGGRRHTPHNRHDRSAQTKPGRQAMMLRREERIERRARDAVDDPWACPRPDKTHHATQQLAEARLADVAARRGPAHDGAAEVFPCQCARGWVWGRP